jgi:hypothetical protein
MPHAQASRILLTSDFHPHGGPLLPTRWSDHLSMQTPVRITSRNSSLRELHLLRLSQRLSKDLCQRTITAILSPARAGRLAIPKHLFRRLNRYLSISVVPMTRHPFWILSNLKPHLVRSPRNPRRPRDLHLGDPSLTSQIPPPQSLPSGQPLLTLPTAEPDITLITAEAFALDWSALSPPRGSGLGLFLLIQGVSSNQVQAFEPHAIESNLDPSPVPMSVDSLPGTTDGTSEDTPWNTVDTSPHPSPSPYFHVPRHHKDHPSRHFANSTQSRLNASAHQNFTCAIF